MDLHLIQVLCKVAVRQQPDAGQGVHICRPGSPVLPGPAGGAAQQQLRVGLGPAQPRLHLQRFPMHNLQDAESMSVVRCHIAHHAGAQQIGN